MLAENIKASPASLQIWKSEQIYSNQRKENNRENNKAKWRDDSQHTLQRPRIAPAFKSTTCRATKEETVRTKNKRKWILSLESFNSTIHHELNSLKYSPFSRCKPAFPPNKIAIKLGSEIQQIQGNLKCANETTPGKHKEKYSLPTKFMHKSQKKNHVQRESWRRNWRGFKEEDGRSGNILRSSQ